MFGLGELWLISSLELLVSKTLPNSSLFVLFMSQDINKIWMVKFDEPPVIHQIHQGFPLPNIHDIQYC